MASLVTQLVKNLPGFDPWVGKIPWRREKLPTPVFQPREFHGLYSLWGCKESDRLSDFHTHWTCKQPRHLQTDEWIKKLWYIYTMEYYSAIKRNTIESVLKRQTNLEPIIQSEVSQREKNKYCILTHIYGVQKNGTDEPICREDMEMVG